MSAVRACWLAAEHECERPVVFGVLRRDFDPVHPDPARDNRYCCRDHLAAVVELTDSEGPGSGYVVHVSVVTSVPVPAGSRTQPMRIGDGSALPSDRECPDGGACHHDCTRGCFRVAWAGPLSGVFPGDTWPAEIVAGSGTQDGVL
jgi:hypothetical protein